MQTRDNITNGHKYLNFYKNNRQPYNITTNEYNLSLQLFVHNTSFTTYIINILY